MTKQERNDLILAAMQTELQEKPYAKDVLIETFELWVQGLIAQGNDLLKGSSGTKTQEPAPEEQPQAEEAPIPEEGGTV